MMRDNSNRKSTAPDGDIITQVKAQVMTRDDSSGGWVPVSGGGLSYVALVCQKVMLEAADEGMDSGTSFGVEFVIQGRRVADHEVILDCTLMMDLQYVMVNPTFHHWQTGNKRYGLTFQSSSDAHIFEQSIRAVAYETVREYRKHVQANVRQQQRQQQQHLRMISTDTDISMMLRCHQSQQLGCEHVEGTTSLTVLPAANCRRHSYYSQEQHVSTDGDTEIIEEDLENEFNHKMQLFEDCAKNQLGDDILSIDSSYVRFAKTDPSASTHEYCYPALQCSCARYNRDLLHQNQPRVVSLTASLSYMSNNPQIVSSGIHSCGRRRRCVYCGERFDPNEARAVCTDAPDKVMDCINVVTCACVADAVAYHCLADSDGEYEPMCACSNSSSSPARWALLVLLSLVLPCLCCFWPLMGCRRCAIGCGCCISGHREV